jgi:hypothetical protein
MSSILAPCGWGWKAGTVLGGASADDLPEMPMLRFLESGDRNHAVLEMLRENQALARVVRPVDLVAKYRLPASTALQLLTRAKG